MASVGRRKKRAGNGIDRRAGQGCELFLTYAPPCVHSDDIARRRSTLPAGCCKRMASRHGRYRRDRALHAADDGNLDVSRGRCDVYQRSTPLCNCYFITSLPRDLPRQQHARGDMPLRVGVACSPNLARVHHGCESRISCSVSLNSLPLCLTTPIWRVAASSNTIVVHRAIFELRRGSYNVASCDVAPGAPHRTARRFLIAHRVPRLNVAHSQHNCVNITSAYYLLFAPPHVRILSLRCALVFERSTAGHRFMTRRAAFWFAIPGRT